MYIYPDTYLVTIWLDGECVTWKFPVDDPGLTIHEAVQLYQGYMQRTQLIHDLDRKGVDYKFAFCPDLQPPPPPAPPKPERVTFDALVSLNMI